MNIDPLTAPCEHCEAKPGQRCMALCDWARKPHARRVRLAFALTAHADSALDAFFPRLGPCGVCGTPGLDQRHRMIDAVAEHLAAGEDPDDVAFELALPVGAVLAVGEWAARWPGAWKLAPPVVALRSLGQLVGVVDEPPQKRDDVSVQVRPDLGNGRLRPRPQFFGRPGSDRAVPVPVCHVRNPRIVACHMSMIAVECACG